MHASKYICLNNIYNIHILYIYVYRNIMQKTKATVTVVRKLNKIAKLSKYYDNLSNQS